MLYMLQQRALLTLCTQKQHSKQIKTNFMSIQSSYLVQPKYGYDMVVAVTQKALNNTIKDYYANVAGSKTPFTQQTCYFVKDATGNPLAIDKASLLALTNNIDPLTITSTQTDE